jgi:RNA polymerase sigma-70 factor (ECF subfamily)
MAPSPEERFRTIYEQHLDAVTAYVRRRAPADAVQDIVADTFLVFWRKLDRVPAEPLPWLYAVARKTLANHHRATRRREVAVGEPAGAIEVELPADPILGIAFSRLGERDQEVLRLVAWEQLGLHEAADVLGCSPVACRVRFLRAKRRLARHLEQLEAVRAASPPRPDPKGATP